MLRRMTALQLLEWAAFDAIDPIGDVRADLAAGVIASASMSPWCRKSRVPRPTDLAPRYDVPEVSPDDEIDAALCAWAAVTSGQERKQ
jgi:hypothetical protein